MKLLNKAYKTLKDPETRTHYDINNEFNKTVQATPPPEQVITLTPEKRNIYLKVLEEFLPPTKEWNLYNWMINMKKLAEKYKGLTASFEHLNENLTTAGALAKILLQQFTPNNPTENIRNAKIVIKKGQKFLEVYHQLLDIREVVEKLDVFINFFNLDIKQLTAFDIKEVNYLDNLQENTSTKTSSSPNMVDITI